MGKLHQAVSDLDNLYRSWRDVRKQIRGTTWPQLSAEMEEVEAAPLKALRRLQSELRSGSTTFDKKWGYARRKSGGSRRGITVLSVRDRIVQRSILNILLSKDVELQQDLGEIPAVLRSPTSFAGVPGRGVPDAIELTLKTIRAGAQAYVYSDMKDFFPRVPRQEVVAFLRDNIADAAFVDLFASALETELRNPEELSEWLHLFPIGEAGVAQGSLLSVLVGNLSLGHFDARLNREGLTTIRYLDDFVMLSSSLSDIELCFQDAQEELAKLGMLCYEPGDGSHKAALGSVANGFNFLGCRIHPDGISPTRQARRKLIRDIGGIIVEGKKQIQAFTDPQTRRRTEQVYAQTLMRIDRKIRGWGDTYRFVTNRLAFAQVDREIDRVLKDFERWFDRVSRQATPPVRRRMQGVALLSDTPPKESC